MKPTLLKLKQKKLIGMKSTTHHNDYAKIIALWKRFMPRRRDINNAVTNEFIAVQKYHNFNNLDVAFDIYACVEVSELSRIPKEMEGFAISEGDYAVFVQKGMDASATYQRILTDWLPSSGYEIDNRPHFQVMGEKYKNGSPDSEEDFYVPIKLKLS